MNISHANEFEIKSVNVGADLRELVEVEIVLIGGGETASNGY